MKTSSVLLGVVILASTIHAEKTSKYALRFGWLAYSETHEQVTSDSEGDLSIHFDHYTFPYVGIGKIMSNSNEIGLTFHADNHDIFLADDDHYELKNFYSKSISLYHIWNNHKSGISIKGGVHLSSRRDRRVSLKITEEEDVKLTIHPLFYAGLQYTFRPQRRVSIPFTLQAYVPSLGGTMTRSINTCVEFGFIF